MSTPPEYASLCFLSYNRPAFIVEAIRSAVENANYPCEVIVHDDGSSDPTVRRGLCDLLDEGLISHLILNPAGHNEGVGTGIKRMFEMASGDPIIKIDQDLIFEPKWLLRTVQTLQQDLSIGMWGLFKYHHEPVKWEDQKIDTPTRDWYHYTRQFCGSAFAIPRRVYEQLGPLDQHLDAFNEDSNYMTKVREAGYQLALPDYDYCTNRGFGIGPSTVVEEGYVVHKIHHGPYLLNNLVARWRDGDGNEVSQVLQHRPHEEPVSENQLTPPYTEVEHATMSAQVDELLRSAEGVEVVPREHSFEYDWTVEEHVVNAALDATNFGIARKFDVGVVITTCAGREENLKRTIKFLRDLKHGPDIGVVVYDGCDYLPPEVGAPNFYGPDDLVFLGVKIPKHGPGQEQPRNVGFRTLREAAPECNYVWFLDSDLIVPSDCLQSFYDGLCAASEDRILIGPYDWLAPGVTDFGWDLFNDPRWASFRDHGPEDVLMHDLGASLANFGGNLIWPVDRFEEVGGFHPELHHGRCEDGELGLRAGSQGIPMSFVAKARAWHVWHEVDMDRIIKANTRDVPLINKFHPWMPDANDEDLLAAGLGPEWKGLLVTAEDGARFDFVCPSCGEQINTLSYWAHSATHRQETP